MRSSLLIKLLALFALGAMSMSAFAAEPTPAKPAPPATEPAKEQAEQPKSDDKPAAKPEVTESADAAATEKSPADAKASPQRFIPSEQVRADFDVSFPIDI
jgi:hypothetical protein